MNMRTPHLLMTLMLLATPLLCIADPGATMRYLINKPITLLDWGLEKMNKGLDGLHVTDLGKIRVTVTLSEDKSHIIILGHSFREASDAQEARTWCKQTIIGIRSALGVNPDTGLPVMPTGTSVGNYFTHGAPAGKDEPKTLSHDLENMILAEGMYALMNSTKKVQCQAPILGTEITYRD